MDSSESEARLRLNAQVFEAPGQAHGAVNRKIAKPKVSATDRGKALRQAGPSMRTERKRADQAAMAKAEPLTMERLMGMISRDEIQDMRGRKRARIVDEALPTGVWQLGSWVNGDKPCPDSRLEWQVEED